MAGPIETADAPARRRGPDFPRRDSGVTFVELLAAIVLVGTVVIAVLVATRTSIVASETSRDAARVESRLLAVADDIGRAEQTCGEFVASLQQHVTRVDYLSVETGWQLDQACPGAVPPPNLVQRYTISVMSSDGAITRTLQIVKGVPIAPAPLESESTG